MKSKKHLNFAYSITLGSVSVVIAHFITFGVTEHTVRQICDSWIFMQNHSFAEKTAAIFFFMTGILLGMLGIVISLKKYVWGAVVLGLLAGACCCFGKCFADVFLLVSVVIQKVLGTGISCLYAVFTQAFPAAEGFFSVFFGLLQSISAGANLIIVSELLAVPEMFLNNVLHKNSAGVQDVLPLYADADRTEKEG